jgi:hypothetical protein
MRYTAIVGTSDIPLRQILLLAKLYVVACHDWQGKEKKKEEEPNPRGEALITPSYVVYNIHSSQILSCAQGAN